MAAKYTIFVAFALFCMAQARVVRDAPAQQHPLDQLATHVDQVTNDLKKAFNDVFGGANVPNSEELSKKIAEQSKNLGNGISEAVSKIQAQIKQYGPEVDQNVAQITAKINEAVASLKQANPEATAQAKDLQEKFNASVQTIVEEAKKFTATVKDNINSSGAKEEFEKQVKNIYDQAAAAGENLQKQIKEVVDKQQKQ